MAFFDHLVKELECVEDHKDNVEVDLGVLVAAHQYGDHVNPAGELFDLLQNLVLVVEHHIQHLHYHLLPLVVPCRRDQLDVKLCPKLKWLRNLWID